MDERIDFVLFRPGSGCSVAVGDARHWADGPLSEPVEDLWWAADHAGVAATLTITC